MTAPTDTVIEPTVLTSHLVRVSSLGQLIEALDEQFAKVAKRLPDVEFGFTAEDANLPDGTPRMWCEPHRCFQSEREVERGRCLFGDGDPRSSDQCYAFPADAVTLEITATGLPLFDGTWYVAGVLTLDDAGAVTAASVGESEDGFAAAHAELMGICHHCMTNVRRTVTVLLRDRATDEVRAVGRSCLADYTGGSIRAELLPVLTSLRERFAEAVGVTLTGMATTAPVVDVVAIAAELIRRHGFVKSGWDTREAPSTRNRLFDILCPKQGATQEIVPAELTKEQRDGARAMIEQVLDMEAGDSDYVYNLQAVCEHDEMVIEGRRTKVGLIASLPQCVWRDREREVKREREAEGRVSAHIGAVKQRREFVGVVRSADVFAGDYGDRTRLIVDTAEGTVVWWATGTPGEWRDHSDGGRGQEFVAIDRGHTVTITATVKAHDEFRGELQTIVTRGKVTNIEVPAAAE